MAAPVVKFDPTLELPKITHGLYMYPDSTTDSSTNPVNQTKVDGIIMPLICLNDMSLNFSQVSYFELGSNGFMATLRITINDGGGLLKTFNKTDVDNTIQIQILPPFDNAYKKINMLFYVVKHETHGNRATFDCIYKLDGLRDSRLESFGEITTYELFEKLASTLQLGFVSNITGSKDKRWIYCQNTSYQDLLREEMKCSGSAKEIFDSWIDFRNNLTLVNIYERYNTIDTDLKIWTTPTSIKDVSDELGNISRPILAPALISNHYTLRTSPLYVGAYENVQDNEEMVANGTDEVSICYSFDNSCEDDWYMADGSVGRDTTIKYRYAGEYFGEFNYLAQERAIKLFKNKIAKSCIAVELHTVCLGLMRGDKVELRWYECSTHTNTATAEKNQDMQNNTNASDEVYTAGEGQILNNEVSGQYYINGITLTYKDGGWKQKLTLIKVNGDIELGDK